MKRFWDKVDDSECINPDACWNWGAAMDPNGYGAFKVGGKKVGAHVFAYMESYGPVPSGMEVCHSCDNRACCRPSHLFAGTRSDNMRDCSSKGRIVVPTGRRFVEGQPAHNASLAPDAVASIKEDLSPPQSLTTSEIARRHGIPRHVVSDIRRGKTYRG